MNIQGLVTCSFEMRRWTLRRVRKGGSWKGGCSENNFPVMGNLCTDNNFRGMGNLCSIPGRSKGRPVGATTPRRQLLSRIHFTRRQRLSRVHFRPPALNSRHHRWWSRGHRAGPGPQLLTNLVRGQLLPAVNFRPRGGGIRPCGRLAPRIGSGGAGAL